jgi:hypothetical protein
MTTWSIDEMLATALNFADTAVSALMLTLQVPVPLHPPDQALNVAFVPGAAVRVTAVPAEKVAVHVDPQSMPAGLLVTVPVPEVATISWKEDGGGALTTVEPPQPTSNDRTPRVQPTIRSFRIQGPLFLIRFDAAFLTLAACEQLF